MKTMQLVDEIETGMHLWTWIYRRALLSVKKRPLRSADDRPSNEDSTASTC